MNRVKVFRNMPPIVISYPSQTMVHAQFACCLASMVAWTIEKRPDLGLSIHNINTSDLQVGRGLQVDFALKAQASHILMLDSDMSFPPDTLLRLLARGKDVIATTYCQRHSPRRLVHHTLDATMQMPSDPREEIFKIHSTGLGCALIRTDVFLRIPRPWFASIWTGNVKPDGNDEHIPEDRSFFKRVRESGVDIWCDAVLSREIGHCGNFEFRLEHAEIPADYVSAQLL